MPMDANGRVGSGGGQAHAPAAAERMPDLRIRAEEEGQGGDAESGGQVGDAGVVAYKEAGFAPQPFRQNGKRRVVNDFHGNADMAERGQHRLADGGIRLAEGQPHGRGVPVTGLPAAGKLQKVFRLGIFPGTAAAGMKPERRTPGKSAARSERRRQWAVREGKTRRPQEGKAGVFRPRRPWWDPHAVMDAVQLEIPRQFVIRIHETEERGPGPWRSALACIRRRREQADGIGMVEVHKARATAFRREQCPVFRAGDQPKRPTLGGQGTQKGKKKDKIPQRPAAVHQDRDGWVFRKAKLGSRRFHVPDYSLDSLSAGSQAVPEPATVSLLVLGGLALLKRRRRWRFAWIARQAAPRAAFGAQPVCLSQPRGIRPGGWSLAQARVQNRGPGLRVH